MPSPRRSVTGVLLAGTAIVMLGLSYAAVPLYRMFCQQTGYGGTPKIGVPDHVVPGTRHITVRFNADVSPGLDWSFTPLQDHITVRTGTTGLAFYRAKNNRSTPVMGMATYNVTPEKAASYFNKIHCFCFEEQTLGPHQEMEMPVSFFIDSALEKDPKMNDIHTITLSYTFFKIEKDKAS